MNREAGLEYGFSWWRRAAAVAGSWHTVVKSSRLRKTSR